MKAGFSNIENPISCDHISSQVGEQTATTDVYMGNMDHFEKTNYLADHHKTNTFSVGEKSKPYLQENFEQLKQFEKEQNSAFISTRSESAIQLQQCQQQLSKTANLISNKKQDISENQVCNLFNAQHGDSERTPSSSSDAYCKVLSTGSTTIIDPTLVEAMDYQHSSCQLTAEIKNQIIHADPLLLVESFDQAIMMNTDNYLPTQDEEAQLQTLPLKEKSTFEAKDILNFGTMNQIEQLKFGVPEENDDLPDSGKHIKIDQFESKSEYIQNKIVNITSSKTSAKLDVLNQDKKKTKSIVDINYKLATDNNFKSCSEVRRDYSLASPIEVTTSASSHEEIEITTVYSVDSESAINFNVPIIEVKLKTEQNGTNKPCKSVTATSTLTERNNCLINELSQNDKKLKKYSSNNVSHNRSISKPPTKNCNSDIISILNQQLGRETDERLTINEQRLIHISNSGGITESYTETPTYINLTNDERGKRNFIIQSHTEDKSQLNIKKNLPRNSNPKPSLVILDVEQSSSNNPIFPQHSNYIQLTDGIEQYVYPQPNNLSVLNHKQLGRWQSANNIGNQSTLPNLETLRQSEFTVANFVSPKVHQTVAGQHTILSSEYVTSRNVEADIKQCKNVPQFISSSYNCSKVCGVVNDTNYCSTINMLQIKPTDHEYVANQIPHEIMSHEFYTRHTTDENCGESGLQNHAENTLHRQPAGPENVDNVDQTTQFGNAGIQKKIKKFCQSYQVGTNSPSETPYCNPADEKNNVPVKQILSNDRKYDKNSLQTSKNKIRDLPFPKSCSNESNLHEIYINNDVFKNIEGTVSSQKEDKLSYIIQSYHISGSESQKNSGIRNSSDLNASQYKKGHEYDKYFRSNENNIEPNIAHQMIDQSNNFAQMTLHSKDEMKGGSKLESFLFSNQAGHSSEIKTEKSTLVGNTINANNYSSNISKHLMPIRIHGPDEHQRHRKKQSKHRISKNKFQSAKSSISFSFTSGSSFANNSEKATKSSNTSRSSFPMCGSKLQQLDSVLNNTSRHITSSTSDSTCSSLEFYLDR